MTTTNQPTSPMLEDASRDLPLDWLACPVSKMKLHLEGGDLVAGNRRYSRHPEFGFWQMQPKEVPELDAQEW